MDKNYNVDDILSEIKRKKSADKGAGTPKGSAKSAPVPDFGIPEIDIPPSARDTKKEFSVRIPEDDYPTLSPARQKAAPDLSGFAPKPSQPRQDAGLSSSAMGNTSQQNPLDFSGHVRSIADKAKIRQNRPRAGKLPGSVIANNNQTGGSSPPEFRFDFEQAGDTHHTKVLPKFSTGRELRIEDIQRMEFTNDAPVSSGFYDDHDYHDDLPPSSRTDFSEYNSIESRNEVATDIAHTKLWLFIRAGVTVILTFVALFFALSEKLNLPMPNIIWPVPETMQAFMIACTVVTILVALANSSAMGGGLISFFKLRANADSLAAFAMLAAILQCVAGVTRHEAVDPVDMNFYFPVACLAMLFNSLGKMSMINRIQMNFRVLGSDLEKKAVQTVDDPEFCYEFAGDAVQRRPAIAYNVKSGFFTDFLALSYSDKYDVGINRSVAPVCVAGAAIVAIATFFLTEGSFPAISAFTAILCISATFSATFIENIPLLKIAKRNTPQGGMVSGSKAVEDFCDTKAIILTETDLFGKGSLTLHGIKAFSQGRIDEAISDAASVICALDGALAPLFMHMISNNEKVLKKADNIVFETGMGVSAWIDSRRVLVGNRKLMMTHGITLPTDSYERGELKDARGEPIYLSNSGEVSARFLVDYAPNEELAVELDHLGARGIRLIAATSDPNISAEKIWEAYGYPEELITILPSDHLSAYRKISASRKEAPAGIVYTGRASVMVRAVRACITARSSILSATMIELCQIILGYGLAAFLAFMGNIGTLDILRLGLYQLFWFAAISIVQQMRHG